MEASFGRHIAKMREDRGWSQRKTAELAGMTNAELSRLERGQYERPSLAMMEKLSYALDVPLAVLIQMAGYNLGLPELTAALEKDNPLVQLPIVRHASPLVVPLIQEANIVGYAAVDSAHLPDGNPSGYFLVRVRDESMSGANMLPDVSLVLVRKQHKADNGDIALVAVGPEDAVFRYITISDNKAILTATNPAVGLRVVPKATAHILGIAVEVITYTRITKMGGE